MGLFTALGVDPRNVVFSSDTSEEQGRQFGKGRGTVDCCYPVKCISGHYGELLFGQRQKLDVLFSPMIYTLPSFMSGHVAKTLTCPRVMAAPENIKAGFIKERDVFAEAGIVYAAPFISLDEPRLVPKQTFEGLRDASFVLAKTAIQITRFKGLAEMKSDELWTTTMDPGRRMLVRVDVEDAAATDLWFSRLMGDEVEPRRLFIEENARDVRFLDV